MDNLYMFAYFSRKAIYFKKLKISGFTRVDKYRIQRCIHQIEVKYAKMVDEI